LATIKATSIGNVGRKQQLASLAEALPFDLSSFLHKKGMIYEWRLVSSLSHQDLASIGLGESKTNESEEALDVYTILNASSWCTFANGLSSRQSS